MLTIKQDFIKSIFNYDEITGIFTWKETRSSRAIKGCVVGSTKKGYLCVKINSITYKLHRIAYIYVYGDQDEDFFIDHINHNRSDNRIVNLRKCTRIENNKNQSISRSNKTGFTGVGYHKRDKIYFSHITINKKMIHLGYFNNIDDAINARKEANIKYGFHSNHGI